MGVAARVNSAVYSNNDGCQIETFNTGTGLPVGVDGDGHSILCNVMIIGY
jgi:hypothetical protein